jgi:hypothetical protein
MSPVKLTKIDGENLQRCEVQLIELISTARK